MSKVSIVDAISLDRVAKAMVDGLYRQGYFSPLAKTDPAAKIGVVTVNDAEHNRALDRALIPALRSHGLKLTDVAPLDAAYTLQQAGNQSAEASNAVLRFRTEGIDHVIMFAGN